jgi:ferredoxin
VLKASQQEGVEKKDVCHGKVHCSRSGPKLFGGSLKDFRAAAGYEG